MTDKILTKQQLYAQAQKAKGLVPFSAWVPSHVHDDLRCQCNWLTKQYLSEHPQYYIPYMVRNIITGVFRKSI